MSVDDRLASLQSQIEDLEAERRLLADLDDAKQGYVDDRSGEAKGRKQSAAAALRKHRKTTRTEGVTVGGDAYIEPGSPDPVLSGTVEATFKSQVEGA